MGIVLGSSTTVRISLLASSMLRWGMMMCKWLLGFSGFGCFSLFVPFAHFIIYSPTLLFTFSPFLFFLSSFDRVLALCHIPQFVSCFTTLITLFLLLNLPPLSFSVLLSFVSSIGTLFSSRVYSQTTIFLRCVSLIPCCSCFLLLMFMTGGLSVFAIKESSYFKARSRGHMTYD